MHNNQQTNIHTKKKETHKPDALRLPGHVSILIVHIGPFRMEKRVHRLLAHRIDRRKNWIGSQLLSHSLKTSNSPLSICSTLNKYQKKERNKKK